MKEEEELDYLTKKHEIELNRFQYIRARLLEIAKAQTRFTTKS